MPDTSASRQPGPRLVEYALAAAVAYLPQIFTRPGKVISDTKSYLYLDPAHFLHQSLYLWDPSIAAGTVTHEQLGYLFPMGPFFLLAHLFRIPTWVAQRLWLGSILFAAMAGALYLAKVLGMRRPGNVVAALAYMLSPYFLQYAGRESALLLAWAGLPFMIALAERALETPGWRYPALFAIVVAAVGSINATALLYLGLGPVIWIAYRLIVSRNSARNPLAKRAPNAATNGSTAVATPIAEPTSAPSSRPVSMRAAWSAVWRIGLLSAGVSMWWAAALRVEAVYGLNVLKYTETVPAVASASLASEVLRGLGYWYYYGAGTSGLWAPSSGEFTGNLVPLAFSFAVPLLAFSAAALCLRNGGLSEARHRRFFAVIMLVGLALAVGTYPYSHPSPFGALLKWFMTATTAGFALRSTDRATPLVTLSLAMFLGYGVTALRDRYGRSRAARHGRTAVAFTALSVVAIALGNVAVWNGTTLPINYTQPDPLPSYEYSLASWLNSHCNGSRILAEPGENFAAYSWGDTIDPIYPALTNCPLIDREQLIMGSLATADMMYAIDSPIQQGTYDWRSLVPMAQLFSSGYVMLQSNLNFARYGLPRPRILSEYFTPCSAMPAALARATVGAACIPGLGTPVDFGAPVANRSTVPWVDEEYLASPPNLPWPAPVEVFPVAGTRPVVRAEATTDPLIVDGDASGVAEAASSGFLAGNPAVLYAATLDNHPAELSSALGGGATLVVTDTNNKRAYRWDVLAGNTGYTETPSEDYAAGHRSDAPLQIFGSQPPSAMTTARTRGISSVTASGYGNAVSYTPQNQPAMAIDGNLDTAWTVGAFGNAIGQWWQVTFSHPVTASSVNLVQPLQGDPDRHITRISLLFGNSSGSGATPAREGPTVRLGRGSITAAGQTVHFAKRTFRTLRIVIDAVSRNQASTSRVATSPVGFAAVRLDGITATRYLVMPSDLLARAGTRSIFDRLAITMNRDRRSPYPPNAAPETTIDREVWLPQARNFSISGVARISTLIPDSLINELVGVPASFGSGIVANSIGRLPGDLRDTASAALSSLPAGAGAASVMWSPGFGAGHQAGDWIQVDTPHATTISSMDLRVAADGYHSLPTALKISTGSDRSVTLKLPPIHTAGGRDSAVTIPLSFHALTGRHFRFTFTRVHLVYTQDYYSHSPIALPLGIENLGIPAFDMPPAPKTMPAVCRNNLLTVNGKPVWIEVSGLASTALANGGLDIRGCGPDASGIRLQSGDNLIATADGHATGLNIDSLTLDSAPGGNAEPYGPQVMGLTDVSAPKPAVAGPRVRVLSSSPVSVHLQVSPNASPFWLVFGDSYNAGWHATLAGEKTLGAPQLMDGFANGWLVNPAALHSANHTLDVTITWGPQKEIWVAIAVSTVVFGLCLLIVAASFLLSPLCRRRRHRRARNRGHGKSAGGRRSDEDRNDSDSMGGREEGRHVEGWEREGGGRGEGREEKGGGGRQIRSLRNRPYGAGTQSRERGS